MSVLYSPTNMYPSVLNPESSVIDVEQSNTFKCDVYGTTLIQAYRMIIYDNSISGSFNIQSTGVQDLSIVYDSGIVDKTKNPIFIEDLDGNPIPFSLTLKASDLSQLRNGKTYKWQIEFFWVYVDYDETLNKSIKSSEAVFYARKTPSIYITNAPSTITSRKYTFNGVFSQENDEANQVQWVLTNLNSNKIIDISEILNGGAKLSYTYSAFLDNNNYSLYFTVINSKNKTYKSNKIYFNVQYDKFFVPNSIIMKSNCLSSSIAGAIQKFYEIDCAVDNADYTFINNDFCSLHLTYPSLNLYPSEDLIIGGGTKNLYIKNGYVNFKQKSIGVTQPEELSIAGSSSFGICVKIFDTTKDIFSASGIDETTGRDINIHVYIENDYIVYAVNNIIKHTQKINLNEYYLLIISKDLFYIYQY